METMPENASSPSTSTKSGSTNTPMNSSLSREEASLVIRRQPPTHVYPEEGFDVEFAVEAARGSQNSPPSDIEIRVTLESSGRGSSMGDVTRSNLVLLEEPRVSPSRRTGKVRCRIQYGQVSHDGATFCLRLSVKGDRGIKPVQTNDIALVNAKMKITPTSDWDKVWFKDEGGRDKSMEVLVEAHDRDNNLLREKIPLQVTLCYEATGKLPVPVSNQDILRVLGSERKLQLDKNTGKSRVRFRIEDVSKNHQNQNFVLEISGDKKGFRDIAPALTLPVSIRSKRNKRTRTSSSSMAVGAGERGGRSSPGPVRSGGMYQESVFDRGDVNRVRDAIEGVAKWSEEVVNGIYSLQWDVIDYARLPDGNPDFSRPYYKIQNPNVFVTRVLTMYNETREHIQVLRQSMEQPGAAFSHEETSYTGMPPHPPREPTYGVMQSGVMPPAVGRSLSPHGTMGPTALLPGMMMNPADPNYRDFASATQHPEFYGQSLSRPPRMDEVDPIPTNISQDAQHTQLLSGEDSQKRPAQQARREGDYPSVHDESSVEFVLAKQYKSYRTGERLGFPAYSSTKEIVGFYSESSNAKMGGGRVFVHISRLRQQFGPGEVMQANEVLRNAIALKSEAVFAVKDFGSINSLVDHAMVYHWSKGLDAEGTTKPPPPSAER